MPKVTKPKTKSKSLKLKIIKHEKRIPKWRTDPAAIEKYQFIYHFVPHPETKKRATLLSAKALIVYIAIVFCLLGLIRVVPKFFPGVLGYASNISVKDLINYTNKKREEFSLNDLVINEELSVAAQRKAEHMFKNNYWAHVAPDGTEPWDFILAQNYDYVYAGENLAKNFSTSKDVVQAWYDSPSHKDNLLSKNYSEVGFAVVNGTLDGYETTLVVQMFGKPRGVVNLASKSNQDLILEKISKEGVQTVSTVPAKASESQTTTPDKGFVLSQPMLDINSVSKGVSLAFSVFIILLVLLDVWYSYKKGILKLTGHNVAHLIFLLCLLLSVWFVLKPGTIL